MKINNLDDLGAFIALSGLVEPDMIKTFDTAVEKLLGDKDRLKKKATILLSTPGGKIWVGDALAERIRLLSGFVDLRIIAMTLVASSGVRIFLSLPKERRFISPGGVIMIHPCTRDDPAMISVSYQERERVLREDMLELEFSKGREEQWIRALARELGMKYKPTKALWVKSHRFGAKEAVERGLASSIFRT